MLEFQSVLSSVMSSCKELSSSTFWTTTRILAGWFCLVKVCPFGAKYCRYICWSKQVWASSLSSGKSPKSSMFASDQHLKDRLSHTALPSKTSMSYPTPKRRPRNTMQLHSSTSTSLPFPFYSLMPSILSYMRPINRGTPSSSRRLWAQSTPMGSWWWCRPCT